MTESILIITALVISFTALVWNIVRDLWLNRIKVKLIARAGQFYRDVNDNKEVFFSAHSTKDGKKVKINDLNILFRLINVGGREILIEQIRAKYKKGISGIQNEFWLVPVKKLPTMVKPYQAISEKCNQRDFIETLKKGEFEYIYALDSKDKEWRMSTSDFKDLLKDVLKV